MGSILGPEAAELGTTIRPEAAELGITIRPEAAELGSTLRPEAAELGSTLGPDVDVDTAVTVTPRMAVNDVVEVGADTTIAPRKRVADSREGKDADREEGKDNDREEKVVTGVVTDGIGRKTEDDQNSPASGTGTGT